MEFITFEGWPLGLSISDLNEYFKACKHVRFIEFDRKHFKHLSIRDRAKKLNVSEGYYRNLRVKHGLTEGGEYAKIIYFDDPSNNGTVCCCPTCVSRRHKDTTCLATKY